MLPAPHTDGRDAAAAGGATIIVQRGVRHGQDQEGQLQCRHWKRNERASARTIAAVFVLGGRAPAALGEGAMRPLERPGVGEEGGNFKQVDAAAKFPWD